MEFIYTKKIICKVQWISIATMFHVQSASAQLLQLNYYLLFLRTRLIVVETDFEIET